MAEDPLMREPRFAGRHPLLWLIGSCMLLVLCAALVFAIIVAGASVALATHRTSEGGQEDTAAKSTPASQPVEAATFSGVITDSRCGARHLRNSRMTSAECVRACIRKGAHYALVNGERSYILTGSEDALKRLAGTRASVSGTLQGDTILVSSTASPF